jgi:hypothetical protein
MDQHDQEFLSKQLRHLPSPSPGGGGTVMLALVAMFLAGVTLGALIVDYEAPTQTAQRTRTAMAWPMSFAMPSAR